MQCTLWQMRLGLAVDEVFEHVCNPASFNADMLLLLYIIVFFSHMSCSRSS